MNRLFLLAVLAPYAVALAACSGGHTGGDEPTATQSAALLTPTLDVRFGTAHTFATHAQMSALGLAYGLPDGALGVVKRGTDDVSFFGAAATGTYPSLVEGAYTLTGTFGALTQTTAVASPFFVKGAADAGGAPGYVFDRDYAGGGRVVPFQHGTTSGYLMPYHGEVHWTASSGPCNGVPCFYGGIGLAVSTDGASTFHSVGQIVQMTGSLTTYDGGTRNVPADYGSFVIADANGAPLANPPPDPAKAYYYVFYTDTDPTRTDFCNRFCPAVARAPYKALLDAVTASPTDAVTIASLFKKHCTSATACPGGDWTSPGTSGDPSEATPSGSFTELFVDEPATMTSVLWDTVAGRYLMAYTSPGADETFDDEEIHVRTSTNLVDWSSTVATYQTPATGGVNRTDIYPSLIGEGGDPFVGGSAPRVFFQNFEAYENDAGSNTFPAWTSSELDWVPLDVTLLVPPPPPPPCTGTTCI